MYFDNPVLLDFRATIVVGVSAILFGVDAEVNGDDYYIKIIIVEFDNFNLFLLCAQLPFAKITSQEVCIIRWT